MRKFPRCCVHATRPLFSLHNTRLFEESGLRDRFDILDASIHPARGGKPILPKPRSPAFLMYLYGRACSVSFPARTTEPPYCSRLFMRGTKRTWSTSRMIPARADKISSGAAQCSPTVAELVRPAIHRWAESESRGPLPVSLVSRGQAVHQSG